MAVKVVMPPYKEIWNKTIWPREWKRSISTLKKNDANEHVNDRIIALIVSQANEDMLVILQRR